VRKVAAVIVGASTSASRHLSSPPCQLGREAPGRLAVPVCEAADLRVEPRSGMTLSPSSGLLGALVDEHCSRRREAIVREAVQAMGFEWLAYLTMSVRPGGPVPESVLATWSNRAWMARYLEQPWWPVDRRLLQAVRSTLPLRWSVASQAALLDPDLERDARWRDMLDDMAAHDVRSGVLWSLPTSDPHEHVVISLSSPARSCEWMDDAVLGRAMVCAASLQEWVCRATPASEASAAPSLSATQRRVLQRLCDGHGDKKIAAELGMTTHNVDYHLRALRRRFGARNRVQLAQMATLHLIDSGLVALDEAAGP
jgi:DNA-binding CsgD family transcriptional regulator